MERVILVAIAKNRGVMKIFLTGRTRFRIKLWTSTGKGIHYQTVCGGGGYSKIDHALEGLLHAQEVKLPKPSTYTPTLVEQILVHVGGYAPSEIGEVLEF